MKKKFTISFWGEWYNSESFERQEKIKNLPLLQELTEGLMSEDTDDKTRKILTRSYYRLINTLFEDLADHMVERLQYEKKENK